MTTAKTTQSEPSNRNGVVLGWLIISGLEITEIFTGEPWSLNGAIKLTLWGLGSGLIALGWIRRQWQAHGITKA